ncbi:hypothetical protein GCM10027073_73730 [Streptomyces chlorus]|uniref:Trypsin-like serine protease n=1 Tax=Streptomyces chlorus TaxID=887452 RepID=A0ABW1E7M5_9ACTN
MAKIKAKIDATASASAAGEAGNYIRVAIYNWGTDGGGTACSGDSGGPQFKLVDDLRYQVGVTSGVTYRLSDNVCIGPMWSATVPTSLDWIKGVAGL